VHTTEEHKQDRVSKGDIQKAVSFQGSWEGDQAEEGVQEGAWEGVVHQPVV
jgi:hypothetical protein